MALTAEDLEEAKKTYEDKLFRLEWRPDQIMFITSVEFHPLYKKRFIITWVSIEDYRLYEWDETPESLSRNFVLIE